MTPGELRRIVRDDCNPIYKMSLGDGGCYRGEAFRDNAVVFQSEVQFRQAVIERDEQAIMHFGLKVRSDEYPDGNAPESTIAHWRRNVETFLALEPDAIVLHWDSPQKCLRWCIVGDGMAEEIRVDTDRRGQAGIVLHRPLRSGWHQNTIGGIPLQHLPKRARDLAVTLGTIHRVRTDEGYFRALIADEDTSEWVRKPEWRKGTDNKSRSAESFVTAIAARRQSRADPLVRDALEWWEQEVERMADTAIQTAKHANGQEVTRIVKLKEMGFASRDELLEEIDHLVRKQERLCALTGHEFQQENPNPFLRPSLDRIDSSKGYEPGNLQVVTRAANFFKSASDAAEWEQKADAIYKMAVGMKRRREKAAAAETPASVANVPETLLT